MEKKDHIIVISLFVIVTIIVLISEYLDNPTGNVVLDKENLVLTNCKEENNWEICDIEYPDGRIGKEGYKEKII